MNFGLKEGILGLLGMHFDAVVVFVANFSHYALGLVIWFGFFWGCDKLEILSEIFPPFNENPLSWIERSVVTERAA